MASPSPRHEAALETLRSRGIRIVGPTYAEEASGPDAGDGSWGVVAHMPAGSEGDGTLDAHGDSPDAAIDALLGLLGESPVAD